jgi:hypothetical protein
LLLLLRLIVEAAVEERQIGHRGGRGATRGL